MGFRKSPNLIASGAMGVATGVAIAGGLLFALSLPAHAEISLKPTAQIETGAADSALSAAPDKA